MLGTKKKFILIEPINFIFIKIFRNSWTSLLHVSHFSNFTRSHSTSEVLSSSKTIEPSVIKTIKKDKLNDKRYLGLNKIHVPEEVNEILEKNKKFYLDNYKNKINYELLEGKKIN